MVVVVVVVVVIVVVVVMDPPGCCGCRGIIWRGTLWRNHAPTMNKKHPATSLSSSRRFHIHTHAQMTNPVCVCKKLESHSNNEPFHSVELLNIMSFSQAP